MKSVVLIFAASFFLFGCGKKIVECSDPVAQDILKGIIQKSENENSIKFFSDFLGKKGKMLIISNASANLGSHKLGAITSTKIEKEVARNTCEAMRSGPIEYSATIMLNPEASSLLEKYVLYTNELDSASKTKLEEELLVAHPLLPLELSIIDAVRKDFMSDVRKAGGELVKVKNNIWAYDVTLKAEPRQDLRYTTQLTDKGDEVVVTIIE